MSECGAPAFTVDNSTANGAWDVEWIEFTSAALNDTAYAAVPAVATSILPTVRNSPPAMGMPPRWANFDNAAGSAAIYK